MIRFFAGLGVDGVTLLGVLGESNRLTDAERSVLIEAAVKAADRIPVIVGCSHPGTSATIDLCREAKRLGAAAAMIAPSKQAIPNDATVLSYYEHIARNTDIPLVVQDHPASTEVHMSVKLLGELVSKIPAVVAVKAEAVPSPGKVETLTRMFADGPVAVLTGLGALYGYFDLERGANGFNTGFAFPEVLIAMVTAMHSGDAQACFRIYQRYLPLLVFEQQPGVAIRKEILRRRGLIESNRVRYPASSVDDATTTRIEKLLALTFPNQDITKAVEVTSAI